MAKGQKDQFMILVERELRDRLDAIRIVTGLTRGEVGRRILEGKPLADFERQYVPQLARLYAVAETAGAKDWREYVRALVEMPVNAQRVPSLDELEAGAPGRVPEFVVKV